MLFRTAKQEDIKAIAGLRMQLLQEVAEDIPGGLWAQIEAYLQKHLADGTCLCILAQDGDRIIAKAMLCIYEVMPDEKNTTGKTATLFSVYTLPAYRGQKIMQSLLQRLLQAAKEAGITEVTATAEVKTIPLYKRLGFTMVDTEMRLFL